MMRGRVVYQFAKPLLLLTTAVLHIVPRGLSALLLLTVRRMPTGIGIAWRYPLIKRLAGGCGECVAIFEDVYLRGLEAATFGDHISIHPMCYIMAAGGLTIGSNVSIAHGVTIMTEEHDFSNPAVHIRDAACLRRPVVIGDDVWIGAGVRILAGVTIGDHVVIGAGAVVTRDIPAHTVAVGVPARPIKRLSEEGIHGPGTAV